MMKIYTNPTCHYCNKIKTALQEAGIEFKEVITTENLDEWNDLIRITGLGMTPTIIYQEDIWLPNRDFRTVEEIIARVKHFEENPMERLSLEDNVKQTFNAVKNISLLLNQMNQTIQTLQQKMNEVQAANMPPQPHPQSPPPVIPQPQAQPQT